MYRGVEQYPLNGVSMRYTFDDADAPTTKKRQYYAMLGTRGIWQDGWKAAALHAPISGVGHFDQDEWELYHVDDDRSESKNLADGASGEAEGADRRVVRGGRQELRAAAGRPHGGGAARASSVRSPSRREPATSTTRTRRPCRRASRSTSAAGRTRSSPTSTSPRTRTGVIFAHGSRFGGHALFIKDSKLYYVYNFLGIKPEQKFVSAPLTPGQACARHGVRAREGGPIRRVARHDAALCRRQGGRRRSDAGASGQFTLCGDGLCVGFDSADKVSQEYQNAVHVHRRDDPRRCGRRQRGEPTSTSTRKHKEPCRETESGGEVPAGESPCRQTANTAAPGRRRLGRQYRARSPSLHS